MKRIALLLLSVGSLLANDITVTWDPPPTLVYDGTTDYLVQHAGKDLVFTNWATIPISRTNYTLTGLNIGQHSIQMRSVNVLGPGDPSNVVTTNMVWKAKAPVNVSLINVTVTNATLNFQIK